MGAPACAARALARARSVGSKSPGARCVTLMLPMWRPAALTGMAMEFSSSGVSLPPGSAWSAWRARPGRLSGRRGAAGREGTEGALTRAPLQAPLGVEHQLDGGVLPGLGAEDVGHPALAPEEVDGPSEEGLQGVLQV